MKFLRQLSQTLAGLTIALATMTLASADAQQVRFSVPLDEMRVGIQTLTENYDVSGVSPDKGKVDIVGSVDLYEELKAMGYPVELVEVQRRIDPKYLDADKIERVISILQERFPELIHVREIGKSLQGRPIWAVRVSTHEHADIKPAVLFNSMHHAREIMTPEVAVDILLYLTHEYQNSGKPWVRDWVENLAIWVVPQLNPDGNAIVWERDNWWRKNSRGDESRTWGVDLNRNYPYRWGDCSGSSGNRNSQTYRGAAPASEPETRALMNLVKSENFLINLSYHSYSELVIAPHGCRGDYTTEKVIVDSIGKELASRLENDNGRGSYRYGTGWELLYPVDGDDISWMYQEHNVIAYVIEVNSSAQGFQPDYDRWRNITVERQRKGWMYALHRTMTGPQIRGRLLDAQTNQVIDGEIYIQGLPYKSDKPRRTKEGIFYKLLVPGSYELIFAAPGYEPETVYVSIGDDPLHWDIRLRRQDYTNF